MSRSTEEWRAYHRAYYQKRREALKAKSSHWTIRQRQRNAAFLLDYLATHPCIDCGESDPIVLEFDHISGEKREHVSQLARNGCSVLSLQAEISKCAVRCANCHRRKTCTSRGYFRSKSTRKEGGKDYRPVP